MARSLGFLEQILSRNTYLTSNNISAVDILVGFPLLVLAPQIFSAYPKLSSWLASVKEETRDFSGLLTTSAEKSSGQGKNKKDGKSSKGKGAVENKATMRKLRVLCIHGYRQNAKTFREKLGSFRKLVGKFADLDFITAPHLIPSDLPEEQDQYGWWFSKSCRTFDAHEDTDCDLGFSESIKFIVDTIKKQNDLGHPYDGIFSFSQGASIAAYLCVLQQMGQLDVSFKFCVLVAGFVSRTQDHKKTFNAMIDDHQTKVSIPTLHVFGDTDRVIEREMSEELLPYFDNVEILRHSGGHFVPATGEQ